MYIDSVKTPSVQHHVLSHRLRFSVTKIGWIYLAICLIVLLVTFATTHYFALAASLFLLSFFLVSTAVAAIEIKGLRFEFEKPPTVFSGDELHITAYVSSRLGLIDGFYIMMDGSVIQSVPLRHAKKQVFYLRIPTSVRGWHKLKHMEVATLFPFRFLFLVHPVPCDLNYLVYPQPVEPNDHQAKKDDNDTDMDRRPFQPGDSMYRVDWKAVGRGQGVWIKTFEQAEGDLIYDWSLWNDLDDELKISYLTYNLLIDEQNHREYGLKLPHYRIEPGNGDQHLKHCLTALATLHG